MDNVLDVLVEYSKRGKKADRIFIKKVIKVMIEEKELKDYIKKIRFVDMSKIESYYPENERGVMAYRCWNGEILIDEGDIEFLCKLMEEYIGKDSREFEKIISCNALVLQVLLHEIEHANQYKKSKINDTDFENILLSICNYANNEFFKESKLNQLIIIKKGLYLNRQLYYDLKLSGEIEIKYSSSSPTERMANIYSTNDVITILEQIKDIPGPIKFFQDFLISQRLNGYDLKKTIVSPTLRYLDDFKKLGISGVNQYFDEDFETSLNKANNDSLENRLLLGLPITEEEYQQEKLLLPKGLK